MWNHYKNYVSGLDIEFAINLGSILKFSNESVRYKHSDNGMGIYSLIGDVATSTQLAVQSNGNGQRIDFKGGKCKFEEELITCDLKMIKKPWGDVGNGVHMLTEASEEEEARLRTYTHDFKTFLKIDEGPLFLASTKENQSRETLVADQHNVYVSIRHGVTSAVSNFSIFTHVAIDISGAGCTVSKLSFIPEWIKMMWAYGRYGSGWMTLHPHKFYFRSDREKGSGGPAHDKTGATIYYDKIHDISGDLRWYPLESSENEAFLRTAKLITYPVPLPDDVPSVIAAGKNKHESPHELMFALSLDS